MKRLYETFEDERFEEMLKIKSAMKLTWPDLIYVAIMALEEKSDEE